MGIDFGNRLPSQDILFMNIIQNKGDRNMSGYSTKSETHCPGVDNSSGRKDDTGKPDLTDIPKEAMWAMGAAFTYGQKKYQKNNFRKGMKVSRQLAAAIRHIYQHIDGETIDTESGAMHLGHALASIAMAVYTLKNHPELDDRDENDIKKHNKKAGANG